MIDQGVPCRHCGHIYYGAYCVNRLCKPEKTNDFNRLLFAKAIRIQLKEKNLDIAKAARQVGVSASTIYKLSNTLEPGVPDIETFHKIVLWLGADYGDFFTSLKINNGYK